MKHSGFPAMSAIVLLAVVLGLPAADLAPAIAMPAEGSTMARGSPPDAGADAAGWSSGWVAILPGQTLTLTHSLGGAVEDYYVQLWFLDLPAGGYGVNIFGYGGVEADGIHYGTYWQNLTPTTIEVVRGPLDATADRVRVSIWMPSMEHEVCTGWLPIEQANFATASYSFGHPEDDLTVQVWLKDSATGSIHHHGFGGLDEAGQRMGAYWLWLEADSVAVFRYNHDTYLDQCRICVGVPEDPPAYDSGWLPIDAGETLTLTHSVGGNVSGYVVDLEFKDTLALGITNVGLGGDFLDVSADGAEASAWGGHWQRLTADSIEVVRQGADSYIDEVRVRIWQRTVRVFLPVVVRGE